MTFFHFFYSLRKSKKWKIEIKSLKIVAREKRLLMSIDGKIDGKTIFSVSSLTSIDKKVGLSTSFSSKNAAPTVSLFAKKVKLDMNDSESKENEAMLNPPGWMFPSYVQQDKLTNNSNVDSYS